MKKIIKDNFDSAVSCISTDLRKKLLLLSPEIKNKTYEIRLRENRPIILFGSYSAAFFNSDSSISFNKRSDSLIFSEEELSDTFNRLCSYSVHTHHANIINGFVTMKEGHRVGIAGTAVCSPEGEIINIKNISSLNIRIARSVPGCCEELLKYFLKESRKSLLIAGPPGSGKTTLLRDFAEKISSGELCKIMKTTVIDEREEIIQKNDFNGNCDVLKGYPKEYAITSAIKTLSPEIIICDEIATEKEISAISRAVNSGVRFIATVHASDFDELVSRPQIERLLETFSFDSVVLLENALNPCKIKQIYESGDVLDEIYRRRSGIYGADICGDLHFNAS
ncbi:MAG: Flp pilus assembly complex ATPase component TadA [Clostridia bacterium]|nr:Flp pilus assembly complex ATPase component TadA [Clostridia bacterium]